MEINELHRGRLIDHVQLVVRDLDASRAFYTAVFKILQVPMGGEEEGFFWADEFCVSTADSEAAQGCRVGVGQFAAGCSHFALRHGGAEGRGVFHDDDVVAGDELALPLGGQKGRFPFCPLVGLDGGVEAALLVREEGRFAARAVVGGAGERREHRQEGGE